MKRKTINILLIGITILCLVGCNNEKKAELKEAEFVSMIIKDETLTRTSATIIITDTSEQINTFGKSFIIEKKTNGNWKEVQPITNTRTTLPRKYFVDENNEIEMEQHWKEIYGELENGEYRLVKHLTTPEDDQYYFSVEFTID